MDNNEIEIKVSADVSDLEKSIDSATKKVDKQADKMEKSFNDLSKSLNKVKANMNNAFNSNNTNLNGLTNQLNKLTNVATNVASKVQSALKKAFNVEGKVTVKQDVQTTNTTTNGNGGALTSVLLTGGAIGSKIAKELSQNMNKELPRIKDAFNTIVKDMKSEAETLSMVFDGIDDNLIEQMKRVESEVVPIMEHINECMREELGENVGTYDLDTIDFSRNLKVVQGEVEALTDDFKSMSKEGFQLLSADIRDTIDRLDDLTWNLTEAGSELSELLKPRGKGIALNEEKIEVAIQLLEKFGYEIEDIEARVNKFNFFDNLDLAPIINSLEQFQQAQTKADAQPLINELQKLNDEAKAVGVSIRGADEVLLEYAQIDANATKLTNEFKNNLIGVCQQFKAFNAQVQINNQAQALMKQRQAEINSQATTLGKTLVKAKYHLKDFGTTLKQVFSSSVQKAGQYIDNLKNKTKQMADAHKQASDKIKSANNGIMASFKGLLTTIAPFMTIIGAFNLLKTSITDSMGAIETGSKFASIFGSETEEMSNWIDDLNQKLGVGKTQMQDYTSTMYSMASNLGLAQDQAKIMSQDLSMLAQDMASFYNISSDDAFNKLKNYLSGSSEVLYEFGVVATEANLQQFALAQGINKSWSEMSQAEKTTIRYQFAMQGLASASGDLSRTLEFGASYGNI